jgi:hypothetical protein
MAVETSVAESAESGSTGAGLNKKYEAPTNAPRIKKRKGIIRFCILNIIGNNPQISQIAPIENFSTKNLRKSVQSADKQPVIFY